MQFFIFGVPLILLVSKTRFAGVVTWIVILLANIGIIGWLAIGKGVTSLQSQYATLSGPGMFAGNHLVSQFFFSSSLKAYRNYWNLYYQPPWSRVGPYAIGVIGAVFMQKFQREKRQIRPVFYLLGWIIAAVLCLAIMYGKIPMEKNVDKYLNSTRDVMYIMFDRIVWSLSVFFVLFACQTVIIPGQLTFICVRVAAVLLLRF